MYSTNRTRLRPVRPIDIQRATKYFDTEHKAYQVFRVMMFMLACPKSCLRLHCLPPLKKQLADYVNVRVRPTIYGQYFDSCWSMIKEDDRHSVYSVLKQCAYTAHCENDRLTYDEWCNRYGRLIQEPWFIFSLLIYFARPSSGYLADKQTRSLILTEDNFLNIWRVLDDKDRNHLLASWWMLIKIGARIKRERFYPHGSNIRVTLADNSIHLLPAA